MDCALGVDLGGTNIRVALANGEGSIALKEEGKTEAHKGPDHVAEKIADLIKKVCHKKPANCEIVAVGIGSPGPLSRSQGMIFQTPNLPGFENFPLAERVSQLSGFPVFIDNDGNCAAHGEEYFGVAQGKKDFLMLTVGTGIGGGIVCGGKMVHGKSDGAAELGHFTLYPGGVQCLCGRKGCFEQYVSATAIERRASEALGKPTKVPELFWEYEQKNPQAIEVLEAISFDFAIGIGSLINIFDPEMVVLGGGAFSTGGGPLISMIQERVEGEAFPSSLRGCEIKASSLKGNGGVLGAAAMAFKEAKASGPGPHQLKA